VPQSWTLGANVGSDHHLVVAEIQLQTAAIKKNVTIMIKWYDVQTLVPWQFTAENSPPEQFIAGTIHRGTIHRRHNSSRYDSPTKIYRAIHRGTFPRAQFTAYKSPTKKLKILLDDLLILLD
jgi:hypothetical protein